MAICILDRDPSLVNDVNPRMTIGGIYEARDTGLRYIYGLLISTAEAGSVGQVCQLSPAGLSTGILTFTNEAELGLAACVGVGVMVGTVTAGRYTLLQVYGYHAAIWKEDGVDAITIGTLIYPDGDTDGACDTAANGPVIAHTVAASADGAGTTDNTVPGFIHTIFA